MTGTIQGSSRPALTVHFESGHESRDVPFELSGNKVYLKVKVKVDGEGPYWFILDSGSPETELDMDLAKLGDEIALIDSHPASD